MAGALDNKQVLVKIFIGIFVGLIGISMTEADAIKAGYRVSEKN